MSEAELEKLLRDIVATIEEAMRRIKRLEQDVAFLFNEKRR